MLPLLVMAAWVAAGFGGAALAAGAAAAGSLLLRNVLGFAVPVTDQLVLVLIAASGFQLTLLLGAWVQGIRLSGGDRRTGLGIRAIRRGNVVALLCAAMAGWLIFFLGLVATFPALRDFVKSAMPDLLSGDDRGPAIVALKVVLVAMLAPVSEELFFRGWLWEALHQRGYGTAMTAGMTALPWLLLHGIDQPSRILFLLPAALIFTLARRAGDSVLGSLAVHLTNNTAAVLMQLLARLFGPGA